MNHRDLQAVQSQMPRALENRNAEKIKEYCQKVQSLEEEITRFKELVDSQFEKEVASILNGANAVAEKRAIQDNPRWLLELLSLLITCSDHKCYVLFSFSKVQSFCQYLLKPPRNHLLHFSNRFEQNGQYHIQTIRATVSWERSNGTWFSLLSEEQKFISCSWNKWSSLLNNYEFTTWPKLRKKTAEQYWT